MDILSLQFPYKELYFTIHDIRYLLFMVASTLTVPL